MKTGNHILLLASLLWAGSAQALDLAVEPVQPLPASIQVDQDKAALGKRLFFDPRLSTDNSISCAHCHDLNNKGGADGLNHSFGVEGREGSINSPTVFNAALNPAQFWDGRAETLEDQVEGPVTGHVEMASNWPDVVKKLRADATYRKAFARLYATGVTPVNIKHSIAEFERTLLTPNSRFDRYLQGDEEAITPAEKHGYTLFKAYGCVACHQGRNVGGNLFQTLGVMHDYFSDHPPAKGNAAETKAALGRFNVTGDPTDKHRFKVPSLRLSVLTAPYFHHGRYTSLAETIRTMAKYQLGRHIPDEDIRSIIRFLYTLPGEYQGNSLEPQDKTQLNFPAAKIAKHTVDQAVGVTR